MTPRTTTLLGMILLAAMSRLIPHPPNLAPITAMALFGAAYFKDRRLAFLVPLCAMLVSDLALGGLVSLGVYAGSNWMSHTQGLHSGSWILYVSIALIAAGGLSLRDRVTVPRTAGTAFTCSLLFFLLTNFQVWAFWSLYPKTLAGLVSCYVAALPFFGSTLTGDALYVIVLFGGFAFAQRRLPALSESRLVPQGA